MQSEVQLAEANSKEKLLPLDQYLKDCWAKKQTAIDLTAYKITHEELNKVIFGIHYEEPEYYWTIRNDITDTDPQTGLLKTYYLQLVLSLDGYLHSSDAHYLDGGYIKSLALEPKMKKDTKDNLSYIV